MLKMQRLSLPAEEAENTGGKEEATEPQAQWPEAGGQALGDLHPWSALIVFISCIIFFLQL